MGILRATKYKTLLRLGTAVFLLSTFIVSNLAPLSASAATLTSSDSINWVDATHAQAKDSVGNTYSAVGYACPAASPLSLTNNAGTSIASDSNTNGNKSVGGVSVPTCPNGVVADYVWVSTASSPHYVLLVHSPTSGAQLDTKTCAVTSTGCSADVWVLSDKGQLGKVVIYPSSITTNGSLSTSATTTTNNTGTSSDLSCPNNGFSWIICPVISMAVGAANIFDGQITCLMQIDLTDVFGTGSNTSNPYATACGTSSNTATITKTSNAYYHAWNTFRSLALALIVIAGLIMVISQAAGAELLDAYAIRKILPRLLIAGVAITLSWQIMEFLIQVTNTVGYGVRDIIYYPFNNFGGLTISGIGSTLVGLLVGGGAIMALGAPGLLLLALTAILGAIVAFITLILRKLVIIFLLMLAPLAIACYILPNTQKVWKMWWDTLSKALMMFPIIAAMIAVGHVFAATSYGSGGGGVISQSIALLAYFLPYFMIPTAVRMAGGAVGSIGGMISKASQGGFAGLRKRRAGIVEKRMHNAGERAKSGNTFRKAPAGSLRSRLNTGIKGSTMLGKAGLNPQYMRSKLRTAMKDSSEVESAKVSESEDAKNIFGDDSKLWAAQFETRDAIERELQSRNPSAYAGEANRNARVDAATQILRAQEKFGHDSFQRARLRAQPKTGTGYQYTDANGQTQFDASLMLRDINDTYGSDRNGAYRALAEMRSSLANSGQIAGMAGFGTWASQLETTYRDGSATTAQQAHFAIMDSAIDSVSPSQALYGKPASAAAMGAAHARRIQAISNGINEGTHTQEDMAAAMAAAAGIFDAMSQASPQNASAMANELMSVTIIGGPEIPPSAIRQQRLNPDGQPEVDASGHAVYDTVVDPSSGRAAGAATVREYIQWQMNSNPEFVNRRRDLSQATLAQASTMAAASAAASGGGIPGAPSGMTGPPS